MLGQVPIMKRVVHKLDTPGFPKGFDTSGIRNALASLDMRKSISQSLARTFRVGILSVLTMCLFGDLGHAQQTLQASPMVPIVYHDAALISAKTTPKKALVLTKKSMAVATKAFNRNTLNHTLSLLMIANSAAEIYLKDSVADKIEEANQQLGIYMSMVLSHGTGAELAVRLSQRTLGFLRPAGATLAGFGSGVAGEIGTLVVAIPTMTGYMIAIGLEKDYAKDKYLQTTQDLSQVLCSGDLSQNQWCHHTQKSNSQSPH